MDMKLWEILRVTRERQPCFPSILGTLLEVMDISALMCMQLSKELICDPLAGQLKPAGMKRST
jgi:hypothetical protein